MGSELLAGQTNTHQAWLSTRLRRAGFAIVGECSVPDEVKSIRAALNRSLSSAEAVIVCGGLGPTFDDLTREAAASALKRTMSFRPALWKRILKRFARYRVAVPEENKRQAMVIRGARVLDNGAGSAPGQILRAKGRTLVLLPGPPAEMYPMFERQVLPRLKKVHARGLYPASYSVRLSGVPEAAADERLGAVRARWPGVDFTILASAGEVSFHASTIESSPQSARRVGARLRRDILAAVGTFAHGEAEETLESALGARLKKRGLTLAFAESCTGGLAGARLTSVPGSSAYFLGGVVAYSDAVKIRQLGVPPKLVAKHGAVSSECASAMAQGARRRFGSDIAVAITGLAGPGGACAGKPIGTVFIAASGPGRTKAARRLDALGPRDIVRQHAVAAALRLAFDLAK